MFYTYLWLRENGTPYYIGKGSNGRAYARHAIGKAPPVERIIVQDFECESDAFKAETFLILYYGRIDKGMGCLRNRTDGGDGTSGWMPSEETKRRMSTARTGTKGHPISEETRRKLSSEETRLKMSVSAKARGISEETRKKMRDRICSEETRRKLSEAGRGRVISEEGRIRRSEALKGHKISEETRKKISITKRAQAAHA